MHSANLSLQYSENQLVVQSDLGLVPAARAGSDAVFAELHRRYAYRLYRTIISITKNHEDAEDVLQETMIRAYLALDSFEGRSQLSTWLTRIAVNTSLIALRKRRVRCAASFESLSCSEDGVPQLQVKDPSPNPEESCVEREMSRRMADAVAALKPPLRTVMQIHISQECSMKEMARSLDLSVATVKARLHRARRRVAKRMQSGARLLSLAQQPPDKCAEA
jgi:RNA polymerase sigma-70 factor, ECF subfamily